MKITVVNRYIRDSKFNIRLVEILSIDTDSINVDVIYTDIVNIRKYYTTNDKDSWVGFKLDDNDYLIVDKDTPYIVQSEEVLKRLKIGQYKLDSVPVNIFKLFIEIVNDSGFLVNDLYFKENKTNENVEDYFSDFIPKFSQSSMTVSIPYHIESINEFRTKKLIYVEDSILKRDDFYFAIPKERESFYVSMKCEPILLAGEYYIMKATEDVSLYAYSDCLDILYGPLLNVLVSMSQLKGEMIKDIKYLINAFVPKEESKQVIPKSKKLDISRYNKSYIELVSDYPKITKKERDNYFYYISNDIIPMIKNKCTKEDINNFIESKETDKTKCKHFKQLLIILCNLSGNKVPIEYSLKNMLLGTEIDKFKLDNLIYSIKAGAFRDSNIPVSQLLKGGGIQYKTTAKVIKG